MIKQKFIITYVIQIITLFISLLSGILITRIGGPNVVGTLAFAMSFVALFRFLTDMGIDTAQQKLISSTNDIEDYITTYTILKIILSFLFVILIASYYYIQVYVFNNKELEVPDVRAVILLYIAINFLDSLSYIFRTNFIARTERAIVEIPSFIQTATDKIVRILLILLGFGAVALSVSSLMCVILVFPINYILFRNYRFGRFRKDLIPQYLTISLPVIFIMFAQQWMENIDRILLKTLHGTYELGLYTASFSLSAPVKLLGTSIGSLFFPSFSRLLFINQKDEITRLISTYQKYLICFFMPVVVMMILFSKQIVVTLFGIKYLETIKYFPVILATIFIYIYSLPYLNLAYAKGLFKKIAIVSVILLCVQIVLIYVLSAEGLFNLKGLGTAIALLMTNVSLFFIYHRISRQIIPIYLDRRIFALVIFGAVIGVFSKFLLNRGSHPSWIIVLYLAIMLGFEWKTKILEKSDFHFLVNLINIRSLFEYVKKEIVDDQKDKTS